MRVLVISSHDLAKECFTGTNDQVFATSPRTTAGRLKAYDHALTAFSAYGPHWRQSRKLAILNLLCAHKVESFFHVQSSEVDMTIRQLYRMWVENHSEPAKGVMQWWLGNLTVNIMARIEGVGRGDEPFDWRAPKEAGTWRERGRLHRQIIISCRGRQHVEYSQCSHHHQGNGSGNGGSRNRHNHSDARVGPSLTPQSSHTLRKAQAELDTHVGKQRHVDQSDIIIKETLRLYPAGPILPRHEAMAECHVGGFHVESGTCLLVKAWKTHRDPTHPSDFWAVRFMDGRHVELRDQRLEFIPFGYGRRLCPGIISPALPMLQTCSRTCDPQF
ncbi:methyltetrahydroprotoberberine 14-monooxygenase-like [Amborella trichopoda]|uniref:methyltetrahydroprotoberberine 14-monooxygenase-like n=1 Tax=Amborella trichopoda TaxID=13333 RepID=UPI0009C13065|nr:methyltetrahydroprotoberberine 14-monooxygenase-like [Amborella trichopoda]|eukprot:XP_020530354.1 methyltetrahydroprotoberberine 14-monooxygenase-like [Amborella trichopoda]